MDTKSFLWVILILVVAAAAVYILYPVKKELNQKQAKLQTVQGELHNLRKEQNRRQQENNALKTSPAAVEKVAREEFKMVRHGESVVYIDKNAEKQWNERRDSEKKQQKN